MSVTENEPVNKKKFQTMKRILAVLLVILAVGIVGGAVYVNDYYRAGAQAAKALQSDEKVTVTVQKDDSIVFEPATEYRKQLAEQASVDNTGGNSDSSVQKESNESRGFVFYPGGKVEYTAYAPLLRSLAEKGWTCVLVKMPFNLAVFDINAADDIPDRFPQVDSWYVGGHSFGGAMAANFVAEDDDFDGLVLLASYSTVDLSRSGLRVFSIYGSEDRVLNHENYARYRTNLPADAKELVIEGGSHAQFGDYGPQEGDGVPTISADEQIADTVDYLTQ